MSAISQHYLQHMSQATVLQHSRRTSSHKSKEHEFSNMNVKQTFQLGKTLTGLDWTVLEVKRVGWGLSTTLLEK